MPSHSGVEHDLFEAPPPPPIGQTPSGVPVDLSDAAQSEPPPPGHDSAPPLFGLTHAAPTKSSSTPEDIDFLLGLQGSRGTTATLQSPSLADLARRPPSEPPLPPVDVDIDDALVPTQSKLATAPVERDALQGEPVGKPAIPGKTRPDSTLADADARSGLVQPSLVGAVAPPTQPVGSQPAHTLAKSRKRPAALLALAALGLSGAVLASTVLTRPQKREEPPAAPPPVATAESTARNVSAGPAQPATEPESTAPTTSDETPTARAPATTKPARPALANSNPSTSAKSSAPATAPARSEPARSEPARSEPARPAITPRPSAPRAPVGADFDRQAAVSTLTTQASQASSCRKDGDPSGTATVIITFAPSGRVTSANVNGPPFAGTPTGGCIAAAFRRASVPAFDGDKVTVSKTVVIR